MVAISSSIKIISSDLINKGSTDEPKVEIRVGSKKGKGGVLEVSLKAILPEEEYEKGVTKVRDEDTRNKFKEEFKKELFLFEQQREEEKRNTEVSKAKEGEEEDEGEG